MHTVIDWWTEAAEYNILWKAVAAATAFSLIYLAQMQLNIVCKILENKILDRSLIDLFMQLIGFP